MDHLEIENYLNSKELNILTKILRGIPLEESNKILWDIIDEKIKRYVQKHRYGFGFHPLVMHFDETFNQSTIGKVTSFLNKFSHVKKWSLYSDYAFYNKDKKNDVASFVLLPYIRDFETLSMIINELSSKDLKKNRKIRTQFLNFFNNFPMISFNFILEKNRFKTNPILEDKKYFVEISDLYINYQIFLTIVDFEKYEDYNEKIKKYVNFKRYASRNNANRKMLHDLILIGQLSGYLSATISRIHGNIDLIGWFSDKDSFFKINTANIKNKIPYIIDFYSETSHLVKYNYNAKDFKLAVGTSEDIEFLDDILRLPDLLAGTMADWDIVNNTLTHDKFIDIIDNIFINNMQHFFIKLNVLPNNSFQSSILDIRLKENK